MNSGLCQTGIMDERAFHADTRDGFAATPLGVCDTPPNRCQYCIQSATARCHDSRLSRSRSDVVFSCIFAKNSDSKPQPHDGRVRLVSCGGKGQSNGVFAVSTMQLIISG